LLLRNYMATSYLLVDWVRAQACVTSEPTTPSGPTGTSSETTRAARTLLQFQGSAVYSVVPVYVAPRGVPPLEAGRCACSASSAARRIACGSRAR